MKEKMKKIKLLLLGLILFISNSIKAADIFSFAPEYHNIFAILGPITNGDYEKLVSLTNHLPYGQAVIFLNSPGGVAYEGIAIGEYVRNKGFTTAVAPIDECDSSCAIIWAAGKYKSASFPGSKIGFHALYNPITFEQSGKGNAKLGAVLGRWGYSDSAIEFMTEKGHDTVNYLDKNKAYLYNIDYLDMSEQHSYQLDSSRTRYTLSAYDVVSGFYSALSNADGDLAAAYVIPEKRGIGPFNQLNIYKFYSSLKQPLVVHNITQVNESQFRVNYSFVKTKSQCNGNALVTVKNRNGYYLIQSIKANC
jgi:periplasmic protein-like protein